MMAELATKKCESCGRTMYWAISPNGKHIPLERVQTVYCVVGDQAVKVDPITFKVEDAGKEADGFLYISHYVSCKNPELFSGRGKA